MSLEQSTAQAAYDGKPVANALARVLGSPVGERFTTLLERMEMRRPNLVQILTYHRIRDAAAFEQQMRYVATHFHVASMQELLSACAGGCALPPRSAMITFDDAYRNFAECAWPVLRRLGLPVTLFVPTAYPDQPERLFWWDRLEFALSHTARRDQLQTSAGRFPLKTAADRARAYRQMRVYVKSLPHANALAWTDEVCGALETPAPPHCVLSWDALRRLAREGVTLCPHTRTHPLLNRIPTEEAREEAVGSWGDLEREIGSVLPAFAYPDGRVTNDVVEALRGAGFALAFTTERGTNDLRTADRLRLRRINVGERATVPILRARLLEATPYLDRWRSNA
jgi:peptidoglycan/xylan/chitin deacetylase (PgdA/CDA1 family)